MIKLHFMKPTLCYLASNTTHALLPCIEQNSMRPIICTRVFLLFASVQLRTSFVPLYIASMLHCIFMKPTLCYETYAMLPCIEHNSSLPWLTSTHAVGCYTMLHCIFMKPTLCYETLTNIASLWNLRYVMKPTLWNAMLPCIETSLAPVYSYVLLVYATTGLLH